MSWTVLQLIEWSENFLRGKGVDSPRLDSELLLGKTLKINRVQLYVQFDRPLDETELTDFKDLLKRRAAREPLAYILGEKEFFSLRFEVGPDVLIPRPETEDLVERAISHLKNLAGVPEPRVLDLATGSGCILIALLKNCPTATGLGIDLSDGALAVAKRNAQAQGVLDRTSWRQADLRENWREHLEGSWDLLTANLPYVPAPEWEGLQEEITGFEPRQALTPGPKGTEAFDWIFPQLRDLLSPTGMALFEIGSEQGDWVRTRALEMFPTWRCELHPDLAGRDRILSLASPDLLS